MDIHHFEEELAEGKGGLEVLVELGDVEISSQKGRTVTIDAETQHMDVSVRREKDTVYVRVEQDDGMRYQRN
jgi:hypothetical protein